MVPLTHQIWKHITREAKDHLSREPYALFLQHLILDRTDFADALAAILATRLNNCLIGEKDLQSLLRAEISAHGSIAESAAYDLQAVVDRDPAASTYLEPFLFFKGFQALQAHRIAHSLWKKGRQFPALMIQSIVSQKLDVDIHPAAQIGKGILMDHATNVVIGETAVIGNNVSILHGVSLGGTGKERGDRHPKIADGVMIGAHAQLLGNIRIGKGAKIGAGAVVLADVPAHTTVAGIPAVRVGKPQVQMPALDMQQDFTADQNIDRS